MINIDDYLSFEVAMFFSFICSQFTAGPKPIDVFMKAYIPRIFMGVIFAAIVWWTSRVGTDGQFPVYYYIILIIVFLIHQVQTPASLFRAGI